MPADTELLERWRGGDLAAGEALFERYYEPVERFFVNKISVDVGDLVQETFMACVENRDRVADGDKFRSYLFAVAYNVLCGFLRRTYRAGREIDFDGESVTDLEPSPSSVIVHQREQRLLLHGLRDIPVRDQMMLELYYWEGMTTTNIAEVLGVSPSTARTRLRRAREHLEAAMQRLSNSGKVLESTLSHLDDWARGIQARLSGSLGTNAGRDADVAESR